MRQSILHDGCDMWNRICLPNRSTWVSFPIYSAVRAARSLVFCVMCCKPSFVLLPFFTRSLYLLSFFAASDCPFGIVKMFLVKEHRHDICNVNFIWFFFLKLLIYCQVFDVIITSIRIPFVVQNCAHLHNDKNDPGIWNKVTLPHGKEYK